MNLLTSYALIVCYQLQSTGGFENLKRVTNEVPSSEEKRDGDESNLLPFETYRGTSHA